MSKFPGKSDRKEGHLWLPTWLHQYDTKGIMLHLYDEWLPDSVKSAAAIGGLRELALFLALTHDVGKLTVGFLSKIYDKLPPEVQEDLERKNLYSGKISLEPSANAHNLNGAVILEEMGCPKEVCAIIAAHHGKPAGTGELPKMKIDNYPKIYFGENGRDNPNTPMFRKMWQEWVDFALELSGFDALSQLPKPSMPAQLLLSGLLVMADWIASNTAYFPLLEPEDCGSALDLERRAESAWKLLRLSNLWLPFHVSLDESEFQVRFGFAPNTVQSEMMSAVRESEAPGIFILEAQMGVGKTEAALAGAEMLACKTGCGGIFFGLPTQATANGIFPRILQWSEQQAEEDTRLSVRLAHGAAALNEEYRNLFETGSNIERNPFFEGRKQALLANMVVGTVDQLLLMALKQKHLMLRHLGIAGKVVIVDECHAYDAYMNRYLDRALSWLGQYGVPVIILSATLPSERRSQLVDAYLGRRSAGTDGWRTGRSYPLLTYTDGEQVKQRAIEVKTPSRNVKIVHLQEEKLTETLETALSQGGCAGVIVNTVKRAQETAKWLREALPGKTVLLFHAHYLLPDRADKEKELLQYLGKASTPKQRDNLIVVGTQVLEQSLDIDFDLMVTDICPMDLLLQRMGRLHRHEKRDAQRPAGLQRAQCFVMGADGEPESGAKAIYGEWLLHRTAQLLPKVIRLPESIPELVQDTYEDVIPALTEAEEAMLSEHRNKCKIAAEKAGSFCIKKPQRRGTINGMLEKDVSDSEHQGLAAVRDGEPAISVLVMVSDPKNGRIGFLPWQNGGQFFSASHVPCAEDCREIAKQQLKLPAVFSKPYRVDGVIRELEEATATHAKEWQQSSWLNGELLLLLNGDLETTLAGYRLRYEKEQGLIYEKEEQNGI